ncbi:MAG: TMEM43 family protein [Clostridia bacterium]|nr:TMEM43 family protein [Clostridia bacterium]
MEINLNNFTAGNGQKKKGNSFLGALLLILIGTILLAWNEYNNVQNIKVLAAFEKEAVEISSETVDPQYDGKAVTTNGKLTVVDEPLQDDEFNVAVKTARLKRIVEMYQWEEKEENDDGRTTYRYSKVWSDKVLDVSHDTQKNAENPKSMPFKTDEYFAKDVKVGAYNLSADQIEYIAIDAEYDFSQDAIIDGYTKQGHYMTNARNLENPNIGDIRIIWKYNDWTEASVAATVAGNSFKDFKSSDSANSINRVDKGLLSKDELCRNQQNENNMLKWILRAVGALMILFGYLSLISFITRFTNKIPVLGSIVGWALSGIAFLLAVIHSLVIIIVFWFIYRPVLAIIFIAIIIAAIVGIVVLLKKKKGTQAAA